jgi:putative hydrolase of the HAD superfamily
VGYVENVDIHRLNNLLTLKQQYQVILLSNTNPFIVEWAESDNFSGDGHPLDYYFHHTFYSCDMKDYKPAVTIFQKMLQDSGINPQETLFLDDGEKNIRAAESIGIHGLLVEKNQDWMPMLTQRLSELNK